MDDNSHDLIATTALAPSEGDGRLLAFKNLDDLGPAGRAQLRTRALACAASGGSRYRRRDTKRPFGPRGLCDAVCSAALDMAVVLQKCNVYTSVKASRQPHNLVGCL